MTVSYEYHTFSAGIYGGTLSQELLKPQPVVLGLLGTNLAIRIWHLLFGLPIIIFVGIITKTAVDLPMVLLALPALLLAATLRFLFTYLLDSLRSSFLAEHRWLLRVLRSCVLCVRCL